MSALVLRGGTIVTMDAHDRVVAGDLAIVDGAIASIGGEAPDGARVIDASGCIVMPGLVQIHVHLCQTLLRGHADDRPLLAWLRERIWPFEAAHDEASLAASARLGLAELLRGGTTAILDMGTVRHQDVVFEAMAASGIRGFSGKAMMDAGDGVPSALLETARASVDETEALATRWDGRGRIGYAVAPRFILSSSTALMEGAADLCRRRGLHLHTHASEHADECAHVRARFGCDNVEALDRAGLLGPRTVLAHCVHVTDGERALLARTGAAVAHCPSANLKLGSGLADVVALRAAGVTVGIGADGAACNNLLDGWTEIRMAGLVASVRRGPGALATRDLLAMATSGGARALGLGAVCGSIEPGKRADVIVVEPPADGRDALSHLAWSARPSDVRDVFVDGQAVVRDRVLLTIDEERARAEGIEQWRRLRARA